MAILAGHCGVDRVRSRFVAAEVARDVGHDVHAGTRALKALRMVISLAATRGGRRCPRSPVFCDITAAFVHSSLDEVVEVLLFHRFPFDLLIQVSTTQLSSFSARPLLFSWLLTTRLKMQYTLSCLVHRRLFLQTLVLLPVLLLILTRRIAAPTRWRKKSTKSMNSYHSSCKTHPELKIVSRGLLRQSPPSRRKSQVLSKLLGASWLALPHWKKVQLLALVALTRQDLGTYSDVVMAPQPLGLLGPKVQGHLMTIEIRDVDLIPCQALRMNMHEVLSYYGSRVNNTTLGSSIGSITLVKIKHASLQ